MDVLLVHGTTQSAIGWRLLAEQLRARGFRCATVEFPTDQPDWLSDDYAAETVRQVRTELDAPIVVAHSGAGLMLPAISRRLGASRLVWLAAVIPSPDGASFIDELSASSITDERGRPVDVALPEWKTYRGPDSESTERSAHFLFHDCDLKTRTWALGTLRQFVPRAVYGESIDMSGLPPSIAVVPLEERSLNPQWLRRAAVTRLGVTPIEIPGGHCPHVSRPDTIAELVADPGVSRL